jgi:LuxR family maltose regulon positive regulatory protein
MLRVGRHQHHSALDAFAAAAEAHSLLTGVHAHGPRIAAWLATTQARLGRQADARATLDQFRAEPQRMGAVHNARAAISLSEGEPATALNRLRDVRETPTTGPAFTLVEAHLLAGSAYLQLGDPDAAAGAAEAALTAAEPDRLIFPFALTEAAELLDALPRHKTAHGALRAEIVDLLRGSPVRSADGEHPAEPTDLSPTELRVLRYLPTNMTRPEIARELYVSINTVNTHIRNIYSKLGASDRSSAVQRARGLRLLSTRRA